MLGEIDEIEMKASQRGARLQVIKKWMESRDWLFGNDWTLFLAAYPEAIDWFDEDGVPR